jgi:predicted ArsR family transcriptional regulator
MSCRTCEWFQPDAARPPVVAAADIKSVIRSALASEPHGLTFEELSGLADLNPNTVRGRLSELERAGVVRSLSRRRRTDAGRRARVYVLAVVPALVAGGTLEGGRP